MSHCRRNYFHLGHLLAHCDMHATSMVKCELIQLIYLLTVTDIIQKEYKKQNQTFIPEEQIKLYCSIFDISIKLQLFPDAEDADPSRDKKHGDKGPDDEHHPAKGDKEPDPRDQQIYRDQYQDGYHEHWLVVDISKD